MGSKSKTDSNPEKGKKYPEHSTPIPHNKKSKKKKSLDKLKDRAESEYNDIVNNSLAFMTEEDTNVNKSTSKKLKDGYELKEEAIDVVSKDNKKQSKKEHKSSKKRKIELTHEVSQNLENEGGSVSESSVYSIDVQLPSMKKKKKHKKNEEEDGAANTSFHSPKKSSIKLVSETSPVKAAQPVKPILKPADTDSDSSNEDEIKMPKHATAQPIVESKIELKTEDKEGSAKYNIDIIEGWPKSDLIELIHRMQKAIPKADTLKFNSRVDKLDWNELKFAGHTAEECKESWKIIEKKIRGFRLLSEMLADAKDWIEKPWTDFYRSEKKNRHPDLPKRPLSSYMLFYMDNKEKFAKKHPGLEMTMLSKIIAEKFNKLSQEKKDKYSAIASSMREEYKEKMRKFLEDHPVEGKTMGTKGPAAVNRRAQPGGMPGPVRPVTPFKLYLEDRIKQHKSDPGFSLADFTSQCKLIWKTMSKKKKIPWIRWAYDSEVKYLEEVKLYKSANPNVDIPPMAKSILSKDEKAILERMDGKPEKPPNSGYSLFSRIMLKDPQLKSKYETPKARLREIAKLWKDVPNVDREMYAEECQRLLDSYKMEYATYLESLPEDRRLEELASNIPKRKTIKKEAKPKAQKATKDAGQMKIEDLLKKSAAEPSVPEPKKEKDIFTMEPQPPPSEPFALFKNDAAKNGETSEKKLKKAWADLSNKEKEKYSVKLQELKQKYFVDYRAFLTSLKPDELKTYSVLKGANKLTAAKESDSESSEDSEESSSSDDNDNSEEEEEDKDQKVQKGQLPGKDESSESDSSDSSGSELKLKFK